MPWGQAWAWCEEVLLACSLHAIPCAKCIVAACQAECHRYCMPGCDYQRMGPCSDSEPQSCSNQMQIHPPRKGIACGMLRKIRTVVESRSKPARIVATQITGNCPRGSKPGRTAVTAQKQVATERWKQSGKNCDICTTLVEKQWQEGRRQTDSRQLSEQQQASKQEGGGAT